VVERLNGRNGSWRRTVFDTSEWLEAWSRATIERVTALDSAEPGMWAVEWSPFWAGYEADAEMDPVWDRPVLTIGSMYSFYGPSYLLSRPGAVEAVMERAAKRAEEWETAGVLVANLPEEAALAWAELHPPDASLRLDVEYHRTVGEGADPVVGDVAKRVRGDWRRRWRRATEQGLRLVEEDRPEAARIDEVLALANESALRHSWPPVYDRASAEEVLRIPGSRLLRADHEGQTVAGFVVLEHERRLYLWAGGTHPELLREVSPYLFILYELLATGAERGLERIEFGRGNDEFKRKYGFDGTELWSLWYARRPEDVPVYRPRLETLHERLVRVMGLEQRELGEPGRAPAPASA
jgi:hypothetical protein